MALALMLAASGPVLGQGMRASRGEYLAATGLTDTAQALEDYLHRALVDAGHDNATTLSEFFAFVMAIHGLDLDKVARLHAGGVDIVHAMTSDARPFIEQGLFSDPVILGEVVETTDTASPADGYQSSIAVQVLETMKGEAGQDTLYLRQRGTFSGGMGPREFAPSVGQRYLLLLSRPMYEFFVWRRGRTGEHRAVRPGYAAIYRHYLAEDNQVTMGDGSSFAEEPIAQELRWLQELMEEL